MSEGQIEAAQFPVAVIGAGIMGAGIAQIAALAGHTVFLFDTRGGAAAEAKAKLASSFEALIAKGKLEAELARAALARIHAAAALAEFKSAGIVIEAVVENLEVKRALFAELEGIVSADCLLASNTSSLSITAMARMLKRPERLVGMHFFNPVPLMALVEVVSGLHTDPKLAEQVFVLAKAWKKVPVHARSTPGFIVNRIARPFYAEALALLQERAASPELIDACVRAQGFRMGPCELMDLIGHDTNFAVTRAVYEANFFDKRYMPSLVQSEMVDAGFLGRKSGRGFYTHPQAAAPVWPKRAAYEGQTHALAGGFEFEGGLLLQSCGKRAARLAQERGLRNVAVYDRAFSAPGVLAFSAAPDADAAWLQSAEAVLAREGYTPVRMADSPGLIATRLIGMLINEAADAVQQGVCDEAGADAAMKLGVNYPKGPFEWLAQFGRAELVQTLDALDAAYRGERYRTSAYFSQ